MPLTTAPDTLPRTTAARILDLLLAHHRTTDPSHATAEAFPHQLRRIADFVREDAPVVLTLPGFPCKSPNPAKTLGHLPDMGERLSLAFLDTLCAEIEEIHAPGAHVVICSDGHVFGDLIRVPDAHIDAYSDELRALIRESDLRRLSVFDLRDVLGDLPHDTKRAHVHDRYAPPGRPARRGPHRRADPRPVPGHHPLPRRGRHRVHRQPLRPATRVPQAGVRRHPAQPGLGPAHRRSPSARRTPVDPPAAGGRRQVRHPAARRARRVDDALALRRPARGRRRLDPHAARQGATARPAGPPGRQTEPLRAGVTAQRRPATVRRYVPSRAIADGLRGLSTRST